MITIKLDNTCDPEGNARRIYLKWNYVPMNGFILNNQDVVERAWFHYSNNSRKGKSTTATDNDIPGTVIISYDDSVKQLKGSNPQKIITALQYWWSTGEEW